MKFLYKINLDLRNDDISQKNFKNEEKLAKIKLNKLKLKYVIFFIKS